MKQTPFHDRGAAHSCLSNAPLPRYERSLERTVGWIVASCVLILSLSMGLATIYALVELSLKYLK